MKITETTTFKGMLVNLTAKSGMLYKYVRINPGNWIYLSGGSVNPNFTPESLDSAYSKSLE